MKLYLSADIEGVACVAAASETDLAQVGESAPFRAQMTAEVQAACDGAFAAGASEVVVKDAHGSGRNIDPHRLTAPAGCALQLIRGWSGHPLGMVQELDASFAGLLCVGFHSAAGSDGSPLAHTVSGRLLARVLLNGEPASEFRLHALAAAELGVPVRFVSGDQALCEEAQAAVDGIVAVPVLQGIGPSVRSLLPQEALRRIRGGVQQALGRPAPPLLPVPADHEFTLEFHRAADAYARSFYPGVQAVGARALRLHTRRYLDGLTFLRFAVRYQ